MSVCLSVWLAGWLELWTHRVEITGLQVQVQVGTGTGYSALFFSASSSTIDSSCGGLCLGAGSTSHEPAVAMLAPRTLAARAKIAPLVRSDARMLARLFVARAASASCVPMV